MISMGGGLKVKAHRRCAALRAVFYAGSLKLRLDSPHKKSPTLRVGLFFGRDGEIRTHDPLHPIQVRYRAALHPDFLRW